MTDFAAFVPANLYNTYDDSTNPEFLPPNCACFFSNQAKIDNKSKKFKLEEFPSKNTKKKHSPRVTVSYYTTLVSFWFKNLSFSFFS